MATDQYKSAAPVGLTLFNRLAAVRTSVEQARVEIDRIRIAMHAGPAGDLDADRDLYLQLGNASQLLEQAADYATPESYHTDQSLAAAAGKRS
jgi:hypothetical protein